MSQELKGHQQGSKHRNRCWPSGQRETHLDHFTSPTGQDGLTGRTCVSEGAGARSPPCVVEGGLQTGELEPALRMLPVQPFN